MGYKKYLILPALIFAFFAADAQENNFATADSVAEQLYSTANWKQLIKYGNQSIADSIDFPGLRFKMGYAYFITGNYKAAISQFNKVLSNDSRSSTARLYAYYCNTYLNNYSGASYYASNLDKETQHSIKLSPFGLIEGRLESGIKLPDNNERDNGFYERLGLSNRLSWRLQLEQSVISFNQRIFRSRYIDKNNQKGATDRQLEYFVKAKYALNSNISLLTSYHYLYTNYRSNTYNSNLGLLGIKYTTRYLDLQGDINWGQLISNSIKQYNAKVDFYPLGNLDLYSTSRGSILNLSGKNNWIYNQVIGFKLTKKPGWSRQLLLGIRMIIWMRMGFTYITPSIRQSLNVAKPLFTG
ncbi:hypothetical protein [Mucilaginibacter sp. SP1R1]|uniref:hypothetical protein n=1 Tax=Mucilaginibacter sp. SP1R1 TaxID=2723091 RepID=UPI003B00CF73